MKKIITLVIFMATISLNLKAQEISSLFKTGPADATALGKAYLEPLFKGFGNSLNGGWTNTAKTEKFLHVSLRITASGSFIPQSDKNFDYTKIGLSSSVGPATPTQNTITPTFGGDANTGASISVYAANDAAHIKPLQTFTLPGGQLSFVPAPQIQLTVGLINNTDVSVRAIPNFNVNSKVGTVNMLGFGIKHNIAQDFGTASNIIPFDLAIAVGYTRLNYNTSLSVTPPNGSKPKDGTQSTDFSNQSLQGHFTGFNFQAILSKKILFFTPFVSAGFATSKTELSTVGNFPVVTGFDNIINQNSVYTTYTNPVNINETSLSGFRADVGFQLNLSIFRVYASYSAAQYQSVNGGIGFGF